MKVLVSLLSAVGLWSPQLSEPSCTVVTSTEHPASIQFSKWLSVFNTADKSTLLAYHSDNVFPYSVASGDIGSIDRELMLAQMTGGFNIVEVESTTDEPSTATFILHERTAGSYARSLMVVDILKPEYPVTSFNINPIITPIKYIPKDDPRRPQYEKALAPLTPEKRQAVVDSFIEVLRNRYVYPNIAEDIAAALNTNLENGFYDGFEDGQNFARQLGTDIISAGHDKHMHIAFVEPRGNHTDDHTPETPPKRLKEMLGANFGFGPISRDYDTVPGRSIATLPINAFLPISPDFASDWQDIRKAIGNRLSSIATADALLLDLRQCNGGDPETVAFVESYLLDHAPIHTVDFINRTGKVAYTFSTTPEDQLPEGTRRFGGTKPLFILTTNMTISGGEDIAYSLQAFKRSKAIIGEGNEATEGSANPTENILWICEDIFGKGWLMVAVPNLRPVHAVTGTNWEGVGVKSDVVAGKGDWEGVSDAQEIGRRLARLVLEPKTELKQ